VSEKKLVGILLVFVLLVTGFSGNVSAKQWGGCGCLAVVDHGVFLNNTTDDNTLLVWVDSGDIFFTSSYNDYYNTTLQGVLGRVDVLRYETDDWEEYGFYTAVYVELNLSLKTIDSEPYRSFRYLSNAIVLLWSHGDRELYETLVDIARAETISNIVYSENITSPDDVAKSLFLYTKAEEKLGEDKVPAAIGLYNAALYNLPTTPTLMWDKITRLSYNGNNTHPVVFSGGGVLHAGWIHREDGGVNFTFYARSTNLGRTWWTLDATTYGSPYLVAMGLDPHGGDPYVAMAATMLLESIYLIDGSHYFYVPINTPPVLPIPVDGEIGDTIYVSIDDPYLDRYQTYEYLRIGDRLFIKPICKPGGTPVPPPRAPDLVVESVSVGVLDRLPKNGDVFPVSVVVSNRGDADVVGEISVLLKESDSDVIVGEKTLVGLVGGEQKTLVFSWTCSDLWATYNLTGVVDPDNDVSEGDESNNEKTQTTTVYSVKIVSVETYVLDSNGEIYPSNGMFLSGYEHVVRVTLYNTCNYQLSLGVVSVLGTVTVDLPDLDLLEIDPDYQLIIAVIDVLKEVTLDINIDPGQTTISPDVDYQPGQLATGVYDTYQQIEHPIREKIGEIGIAPPDRDYDNDGLTNSDEILKYGTDPTDFDTDDDGMPDGWEVKYGLDPTSNTDKNTDKEHDGVSNYVEYTKGTDPTKKDTDSDGMDDYYEINYGYWQQPTVKNDRYAILYGGTISGNKYYDAFWNDIKEMYYVLVKNYNWDPDNIYVLWNNAQKGDEKDGIILSGPAGRSSFNNVMDYISKIIDDNDLFFFLANTHGNTAAIDDIPYDDGEWDKVAKKAGLPIIVISACDSGSAISKLKCHVSDNTIIVTSSKADEDTYNNKEHTFFLYNNYGNGQGFVWYYGGTFYHNYEDYYQPASLSLAFESGWAGATNPPPEYTLSKSHPLVDGNHDGVGHTGKDLIDNPSIEGDALDKIYI